jgi:hypothetical protein
MTCSRVNFAFYLQRYDVQNLLTYRSLNIRTLRFPETLVSHDPVGQRSIPQEWNLQLHRVENFKKFAERRIYLFMEEVVFEVFRRHNLECTTGKCYNNLILNSRAATFFGTPQLVTERHNRRKS